MVAMLGQKSVLNADGWDREVVGGRNEREVVANDRKLLAKADYGRPIDNARAR